MNFSSSSKSVFTVNHSSSRMSTEQMSDIKFIDVDDDEVDDKSCDTRVDCVVKSSPKLSDDHTEHSSIMERERVGVFDYFSPSVSVSKSSERLLGSKSDSFYLGPRSSSKVASSGAKKFIELHRAGKQSTADDDDLSDEDIINANTLPNSSKSWHDHNEHLRQSNSKIYDDFESAGDTNGNDKEAAKVLADRNVTKPHHSSSAYSLGIRTVDSRIAHADLHPGSLYKTELLNKVCPVPTFSDSEDAEHDNTVAGRSESFTEQDRSSVYRQPKYTSENSTKDNYDPVFHHQRAVTQNCAWEVSAQTGNRDSYGAHVLSSRGASICRSSDLVQVTSATSIRCSTGVDTRVGFPLSSASSSTGTGNTYGVSSRVESSSRWPNSCTDKNFGWSSNKNGLQPVILSEERGYNQREKGWKDGYDEQESGQQSGGSDEGEPTDHYDSTAEALRKLQDSDRSTGVQSSQVGPSYGSMYCPQYSLMSQDDEEEEMSRRRMHGHFERMQRRREARRSKLQQTTGYLAAEVPGNRGEDSLEELVSYIDASAASGKDAGGKSRKPNKKKKKAASKSGTEITGNQLVVSDAHLTDSCQDTMTESIGDVEESNSTLGGADDVGEECRDGSQLDGVGGELGVQCEEQADGENSVASHVRVSEWNEKHAEVMPTCLQSCNEDSDSAAADTVTCVEWEAEQLAKCTAEGNTPLLNVAASEATADTSDTVETVDLNAASSEIIVVDDQSEQDGKMVGHFSSSESHPKGPSVGASEEKSVAELIVSVSDTMSDAGTRDSELFSIESFLAAESDGVSDTGSVQNEQFITVQKKKRVKNNIVVAVEEQQARPSHWSGFKTRPFDSREGYQTAGNKSVTDRDGYQHKRPYMKSYEFYSSSTPATTGVNVNHTGPSKYASNTYQKTDGYRVREAYNYRINDVDSRGGTVGADMKPGSLLFSGSTSTSNLLPASEKLHGSVSTVCSRPDTLAENTAGKCVRNPRFATEFNITCAEDTVVASALSHTGSKSSVNVNIDSSGLSNAAAPHRAPYKVYSSVASEKAVDVARQLADSQTASSTSKLQESPSTYVRRSSVTLDLAAVPQDVTSRAETPESFHSSRPQSPRQTGSRSTVFLDTRKIAETTPPRTDISFGFDPSTSPPDVSESMTLQPQPCAVQASTSSCHCSMVNPIVQPGCAPVYYVYHPAIQTLAYQPLVAPYGRCTPIGVVPPMPVMATVPVESVMPSADKISYMVPEIKSVQPDVNLVTSPVVSVSTSVAAENSSKSAFDSYAAQCFLFREFESVLECDNNSLPGQCLVIRFSDLEKREDQ